MKIKQTGFKPIPRGFAHNSNRMVIKKKPLEIVFSGDLGNSITLKWSQTEIFESILISKGTWWQTRSSVLNKNKWQLKILAERKTECWDWDSHHSRRKC